MDEIELLAETDNYAVYRANDSEGEPVYHVDLGTVTLNLYSEEWTEFAGLVANAAKSATA